MSDDARMAKEYADKAAAELAHADSLLPGASDVASAGDPFGRVMLVKGEPGPEDARAGKALAGADGEAATKALEALGLADGGVFRTVSRPLADGDAADVAERLAWIVEAVDPDIVIALDAEAGSDLARVADLDALSPGEPVRWRGRALLAVDGLEASLADEAHKARVWAQLKRAADADRRGLGHTDGG
jgi:hypothetical protein